jgi:hypothetical protein
MLTFEWITAGFALDYVANEYGKFIHVSLSHVSIIWNLAFGFTTAFYSDSMPRNNLILAAVVLFAALFLQIQHVRKLMMHRLTDKSFQSFNGTTTRYFEYSLTAPILMIAVHNIVTQGQVPPDLFFMKTRYKL